MTFDPETATFLIAGPVRIHPRVLRAMGMPSLNHRGDYFHGIVSEIRELLPVLFGAKGHQARDHGQRDGRARGESTPRCSATSGPSSSSERQLRRAHQQDRAPLLRRRHHDRDARGASTSTSSRSAPSSRRETSARVCIVHNETSVGLANDLASIAPAVRKSGALLPRRRHQRRRRHPAARSRRGASTRSWPAARKGLAAPAGLALVHLSDRAVAALHTGDVLPRPRRPTSSRSRRTIPPGPRRFRSSSRCARRSSSSRRKGWSTASSGPTALAEASRAAVDALGLELFPDRRHASDTVTAMNNPAGMGDPEFRKVLERQYNILLQGGQGALAGKIFRIGHMGIADWPDLLVSFAAIERILGRPGSSRPGAALSRGRRPDAREPPRTGQGPSVQISTMTRARPAPGRRRGRGRSPP